MEDVNVIAKDIQAHWRVVQPLFSIRDETVTHIRTLVERFQVSPAVFV